MQRLLSGFRPYVALTLLCLGLYLPGLASVPPLDRDESRFMQASRQMLETGDPIAIHFQDTPRNKKPVGIYWMQAASVAAFSDAASTARWPYRLPSLLGALAAVLATFACGKTLFDRKIAFLGASLLASSLILVSEAHQAKTDAVLLGCTAVAMGILGGLYHQARRGPLVPAVQVAAMWLAVGIGILIKGPVTPMVMLLAIAALWIADRRVGWLAGTRPVTGLPIALAVVLPWFVAIMTGPQTGFVSEAVKQDLLPKLLGSQEAHGGFPGLYLLLAVATLWPGSLFLWPALVRAWKERAQPGVRFCLAWAGPSWLVFELVPTKLPHYPLPTYPAICLLIAAALFAVREPVQTMFASLWMRAYAGIWAIVGIALAAAAVVLPLRFGDGLAWASLPTAAFAAAAALWPVARLWKRLFLPAAAAAVILAVPTYAGVFAGVLPSLDRLWVGPRLLAAADAVDPGRTRPVVLSGYAEPSAVFMLGTETRLVTADVVADAIADAPGTLGVVDARDLPAFEARLRDRGIAPPLPRAEVDGFNYSKGRAVKLGLYRLEDAPR